MPNPRNSPHLTIANRADLVPLNQSWGSLHEDEIEFYNLQAFAAIDAKIVTYKDIIDATKHGDAIKAYAVSGPTADQQPAFRWSTAAPAVQQARHAGQPDLWNFSWIEQHVDNLHLSNATKAFYRRKNGEKDSDAGTDVTRNVLIIIGAVVGVIVVGLLTYHVATNWKQWCRRDGSSSSGGDAGSGSSTSTGGARRRGGGDIAISAEMFADVQEGGGGGGGGARMEVPYTAADCN
jgi:hypothetical protein